MAFKFKPKLTQMVSAEEVHRRQYKRRSWSNIILGLVGTSAWGILETTILRIIGLVENLWPQAHNRFMKMMHGLFGGVVTPFEASLESQKENRTYQTRTPIEKNSKNPLFLKKGEMVILPNEEILQLALRSNARATVSYCFCRMFASEQGTPCPMNAPIRTCLTLSFPEPIDGLVQKEPREDLKKQEEILYKLFKKCDEIGLVHQAIWIPSPNYTYVICNCCPCCCEELSSRNKNKKENDYHQKKLKKCQKEIKKAEEQIAKGK